MIRNDSLKIESAVKVLTYVICVIAFLSVAREIDLSYSLAFVSFFSLSIYLDYHRKFFIPRWILTTLAVFVILFTLFWTAADDPVLAGVEALLLLLSIKLLESKRFRDYMQIYLIALFLLAGSALLSTDISFLLYFICLIFLVAVAAVLLTYFSQDNSLVLKTPVLIKIASRASLIPLLAIPVTLFMFIILPRTNYPLFHFLNRATQGSTGFSDNVTLGKVSDIQEDAAVILRAHMERVDENSLYWRGIVLDYFDGASWKRSLTDTTEGNRPNRVSGKRISQMIYLEPYGNRYLFALDKPSFILIKNVKEAGDLTYFLPRQIFGRIVYEVSSALSDVFFEDHIDRDRYLQMPGRSLKKTRELVGSLASDKDKEATVKAILHFLRDGAYRYSLSNLPLSANPLEDFLFTHKYGNCEYFASAMAVMLRMGGIPSRVVGGYKGGYYNKAGNYYMVPQKNAHVWVEAYLENKGWIRLDPTPGGIENFTSYTKRDIFFRAGLFLDTMNYYWNALIINYDITKQISLLHKLKSLKKPALRISLKKETVIRYSLILSLAALCIFALYAFVFKKKAPEEKILKEFLRKVGKYGYRKKPSEGLEEFVSKIKDSRLKERAFRFVIDFEDFYYRDRRLSKEEMKRLKQRMEF